MIYFNEKIENYSLIKDEIKSLLHNQYSNGKKEGLWIERFTFNDEFDPNNPDLNYSRIGIVNYINGKPHGFKNVFDMKANGILKSISVYELGTLMLYEDYARDGRVIIRYKQNNNGFGLRERFLTLGKDKADWIYQTKDGEKHGLEESFHETGHAYTKNYKNGKLHGLHTEYYHNSNLIHYETNYSEGKKEGLEVWYNQNGRVTLEIEYVAGKKVNEKKYDAEGNIIPETTKENKSFWRKLFDL